MAPRHSEKTQRGVWTTILVFGFCLPVQKTANSLLNPAKKTVKSLLTSGLSSGHTPQQRNGVRQCKCGSPQANQVCAGERLRAGE